MTLIIGIRCRDGVVVGADGAATLGTLGQHTVRQSVRKLSIVKERCIIGVSGPVGLSQALTSELEALWAKPPGTFPSQDVASAKSQMTTAFWDKHLQRELKAGAISTGVLGNSLAAQSVLCSSIVAMPVHRKTHLFQFNHQASCEEALDDLPFVAIGSGQGIADPILAFLRRIFWPNTLPTLADGLLATVWTLHHAIDSSPGGVAAPMQIMVLDEATTKARELSEKDLQEHMQSVGRAEKTLANFRAAIFTDGAAGETEPPPKPSSGP